MLFIVILLIYFYLLIYLYSFLKFFINFLGRAGTTFENTLMGSFAAAGESKERSIKYLKIVSFEIYYFGLYFRIFIFSYFDVFDVFDFKLEVLLKFKKKIRCLFIPLFFR